MEIIVQHAERNRDTGDVTSYTDVARVDVSDFVNHGVEEMLEYAYRYTNNVMGSWSIKKEFLPTRDGGEMPNGDYNEDVTVLRQREDGMGQRSTMVFDRMVVGDETYTVSPVGFKKVERV